MPRLVIGLAMASSLMWFWVVPSIAQESGVYIQNNGVDSSNSAAGADNVRISRNPGNSASNNGAGVNNQELNVVRPERVRKDRGDRNGGGEAAPVADEGAAPVYDEAAAPVYDEAAAPAGDDFQAYSDTSGYDEGTGAAAPVAAPQEVRGPVDPSRIVKLPSTGTGAGDAAPLAILAAGIAALGLGVTRLRRQPAR
jgi:hypothetical protein